MGALAGVLVTTQDSGRWMALLSALTAATEYPGDRCKNS